MKSALARIFVKNYQDKDNPTVRRRFGTLSGVVGLLCNLLLFGVKLFAGLITNAISVTADAFNNLSDAGSSLVTLIGFRLAGTKPDRNHPFGHGRIEYISGLIIAMAIMLMGFELAKTSIDKIIDPQDVKFSLVSVIILGVSILVKLWMCIFNRKIGKYIKSTAMLVVSSDSLSDVAATAVVLISMLINHFFKLPVDGWCGVAVSVFILYSGFSAAKETVSPLLGQAPDIDMVKSIEKTVTAHQEVLGIHDLVVHDYGPGRCMISLHAEVPDDGDINALHDTIDLIERELSEKFSCDAVIHMDPIDTDDELTNNMHTRISAMVKLLGHDVTIHDFRMVTGPTHTNLIFDVVLPRNSQLSEEDVKKSIMDAVASMDGNYYAVVKIDRSYV